MKKEKINNYYNQEDLINFEKLDSFKDLKINELNNNQNKIHPLKYSQSDNKHFNKIMSNNNEKSSTNEIKKVENTSNYYKPLDFKNFKKLKQFTSFNENEPIKNKPEDTKAINNYTNNDLGAFDKIIKPKSNTKNHVKIDNRKIKIIDFNKLNERKKNLKNKIDIEKIKIVYFD